MRRLALFGIYDRCLDGNRIDFRPTTFTRFTGKLAGGSDENRSVHQRKSSRIENPTGFRANGSAVVSSSLEGNLHLLFEKRGTGASMGFMSLI